MNYNLKSLIKMVARMLFYGVIWGGLAGFLVAITILLVDGFYNPDIIEAFFSSLMLSLVFGGSFGVLLGGFGGLFSGIGMMLATALFFREIPNPRNYKYAMGAITFVVTGLVFLISGLFGFEITLFMVALLSVLIAVQASQRVAKIYLSEIEVRKVKEKVA